MKIYMCRENKNKGVSLVELVVIIAIMAILSTGLISVLGLLSGKGARECAQNTLSALSKVRVLTLSKSLGAPESGLSSDADVYLEIKGDSGYIYINQVRDGETVDEIKVSAPSITISAVVGGSEVDLTDSDIILAYDRATGAFLKFSDSGYMTSLTFSQGKEYTITMIPTTGRVELE